ncbi:hypothetical protein [Kitasatospora sp. NPDC127116]|uniref:hypothetical protein n=1 Tax=Kitasatospora sp. NPDC127116 TaxID=3345367 RepID=UPI00363FBB4B
MPWISRRALAETAAAMTRLRDRARQLEADLLEQGRANGRLAARAVAAEAQNTGAAFAVRAAHRGQHEENARLRAVLDQRDATIRSLRRQLDDALGYDPDTHLCVDGRPHDFDEFGAVNDRRRCKRCRHSFPTAEQAALLKEGTA